MPLLVSKEESPPRGSHSYSKGAWFVLLLPFQNLYLISSLESILILYLTQELLYSESTATVIFHVFFMTAFIFGIFAGIIADTLLGKFRTIVYLLIGAMFGSVILTLASVPNFLPMRSFTIVALVLLVVGKGGISPLMWAFAGDQLNSDHKSALRRYFSYFTACITFGILLSMFLTPIFRTKVHCFGESTCYSLAFGFNLIVIIVTLVILLVGYRTYKIIPPTSSMLLNAIKCITYALVRKFSLKKVITKTHWLDYADDKFDLQLIIDLKSLFGILLIFSTIPVIQSLYSVKGSIYVLQATKLDNIVLGFQIEPDQILILYPVITILFLPIFEYIVYPLFDKCNFLTRPLQKITFAYILISLSVFVAGFLQLSIEKKCLSESTTGNEYESDRFVNSTSLSVRITTIVTLNDYAVTADTAIENGTKVEQHNITTAINSEGIYKLLASPIKNGESVVDLQCNSYSILLQVPQYLFLSMGETIFYVIFMDFAYSQAPESMKSIVQAFFYFTYAFSNFIILIVQQMKFLDKESYKLFFYFGLAILDTTVLIILAYNYKYRNIVQLVKASSTNENEES